MAETKRFQLHPLELSSLRQNERGFILFLLVGCLLAVLPLVLRVFVPITGAFGLRGAGRVGALAVTLYVGVVFAAGGASLALAIAGRKWRTPAALLVSLSLLAFPAAAIGDLAVSTGPAVRLAIALAYLGVAAGLALPLAIRSGSKHVGWLGGAPAVSWLTAQLVSGDGLRPWVQGAQLDGDLLRQASSGFLLLLVAVLLWSWFEYGSAVAEVAVVVLGAPGDRQWLQDLLIGALLVWVLFGATGRAPTWAGGGLGVWEEAGRASLVSWTSASLAAGAILWGTWQLSSGARVRVGATLAALVTAVIAVPATLAALLQLGQVVTVGLFPRSALEFAGLIVLAAGAQLMLTGRVSAGSPAILLAVAALVSQASQTPIGRGWPSPSAATGHAFVIWLGVLAVGAVLVVRRRGSTAVGAGVVGCVLAVAILHAIPHLTVSPLSLEPAYGEVVGIGLDPLQPQTAYRLQDRLFTTVEDGLAYGSFRMGTFLVIFSAFASLMLLVTAVRKEQLPQPIRVLVLTIVAIAAGQSLNPGTWAGDPWLAMALLAPLAYQLVVDARPLLAVADVTAASAMSLGTFLVAAGALGYLELIGRVPLDSLEDSFGGYLRGVPPRMVMLLMVFLAIATRMESGVTGQSRQNTRTDTVPKPTQESGRK